MRIAVDRINEEGVRLEEEIEASRWDMDSFDIKFVNKIHIICYFFKSGKEILVETKVLTHRLVTCSRCLSEVNQEVTQNFDFHYDINTLREYLEMDEEIREAILLNYPMKVLCGPTCKGICPGCGSNLNYQECACKNNLKSDVNLGRQIKKD